MVRFTDRKSLDLQFFTWLETMLLCFLGIIILATNSACGE